jgi:hypothetical protein
VKTMLDPGRVSLPHQVDQVVIDTGRQLPTGPMVLLSRQLRGRPLHWSRRPASGHGDRYAADREARGDEARHRFRKGDAQERVDRIRTGTRDADRRGCDKVEEWCLEPATLSEKAFAPMEGDDRHEHGRTDSDGAERAEQAEGEQDAATDLGADRTGNPEGGGTEPHVREVSEQALDTWPAPPSEELLRPVSGQSDAHDEAEDEQTSVQSVHVEDLWASDVLKYYKYLMDHK